MSSSSSTPSASDGASVWVSVPESTAAALSPAAPAAAVFDPSTYDSDEMRWMPPPEQPSFLARLWQKSKQEPFVPIGFTATVACLMFGVYSMGTGDKRRQQLLMRGRVAAQAFTLAAFGYGLYTMRGVSHKQISREKERERKEKAENAEE